MGTDIHGFKVTMASPCSADWASMAGSKRVRFCALCRKEVFELSGLTRAEILELVRTKPGVCVRFFVRADGTLLTEDCPWGSRLARRARRWVVARTAATIAAMAAVTAGFLGRTQPKLDTSTLSSWVRSPPREVIMGKLLDLSPHPRNSPHPPTEGDHIRWDWTRQRRELLTLGKRTRPD